MKLFFFVILIVISTIISADLPCNCRLKNSNRIINGKVAQAHFMPWMASLVIVNDHTCGATILNEKYVLTAAHCVNNKFLIKYYRIHVGLNDTEKVEDDQKFQVVKILNFDFNFEKPGDFGDFALLKLERPIKFIPGQVEPACLNFKDTIFQGDILSAGWGNTVRSWHNIENDKFVLNEEPRTTTVLKYFYNTEFTENCENFNICVSAINKGDSICSGDSGGPLMYTKNGKTSVIGVASFVNSVIEGTKQYYCAGEGTYARLSVYKNYIDKHVLNYCVS